MYQHNLVCLIPNEAKPLLPKAGHRQQKLTMGRDNQPKDRQKARDIHRRAAKREPFDRVLIVSEGEKTEPLYLEEIRREYRLSTANLQVWPSAMGTDCLQVAEYAEQLFLYGDRAKAIESRTFDRVFAVFDRDDHLGYPQALSKAKALNLKHKNNEGQAVPFDAIASVPCFELWLLLHFEDVLAPMHRNAVYRRLRGHLPDYAKGQNGQFAATKHNLEAATARATALAHLTNAFDGNEPYTDMHTLVSTLIKLKAEAQE